MIRIGSRGSQLALWQANHIAETLRKLGHEVSIEIIRTTGDRMQGIAFASVGAKGMFTKEIEDALLAETIDLAVHSLKDLPTELGAPFTLAAIPPRADARDVLVSERYSGLDALPAGAVVGTSSLRRQAQLRARRPDLAYVEFRGNVDTRLTKLVQGKADAIILAAAGLERLEKTAVIRERFAPRLREAVDACEADPVGSARVNVEQTVALVDLLAARISGAGRGPRRGNALPACDCSKAAKSAAPSCRHRRAPAVRRRDRPRLQCRARRRR